jgi:hypothetical protein
MSVAGLKVPKTIMRATKRYRLTDNTYLFLTPGLYLLSLLVFALGHLDIPFFRYEPLILMASLLIVASIIGVILVRSGERLRIFILAILVVSCLDVVFGGWDLVERLNPLANAPQVSATKEQIVAILISAFFTLLALATVFCILWIIRDNAPQILTVAFAGFFLSSVVTQADSSQFGLPVHLKAKPSLETASPGSEPATATPSQPLLVVILLDEMIAPEAIPQDIPGANAVRQEILQFHKDFGFRLFGRAYSRHYYTHVSIPNMFNYNHSGAATLGQVGSPTTNTENAFFDDMAKRGSDINVYQTSHIDFCNHESVTICKTLEARNPISDYVQYPGKKHARLFELFKTVLTLGFKGSLLSKYSAATIARVGRLNDRYELEAFVLWFDEITRQVLRAQSDTVIFTHLLLPHAPYILGESCEITDHPFIDPYDLAMDYDSDASAAKARREYYESYFEQVHCVYSRLRVLLEKMKLSGVLKDATVIIAGDHGSRISMSHVSETMSKQDFLDNYPALFSIRAPSVQPGYDLRFVSSQRLFTEFLAPGRINRGDDDRKHNVVAETLDGGSVELEMPSFGWGH